MTGHSGNRPTSGGPPRAASLMVRVTVPPPERTEVLGDLEEAYRSRAARLGRSQATLWYWSQAGHYLLRALLALPLAPLHAAFGSELLGELWRGRRVFRAAPFFSAVVVAVMALGIGANTAMFDTARKALLEPLPFTEPERLVVGRTTFEGNLNPWATGPDYLEYRDRVDAFQDLASVMPFGQDYTVTGGARPERARGTAVSPNYFHTVGAPPVLGRSFTEVDGLAGAADVMMLSHGYWIRRFRGDLSVVGQTLVLDGDPYEIVGVAAEGFFLFEEADFWRPMRPDRDGAADRRFHNWLFVGRLSPGIDAGQAQAQADVVSAQLAEAYADFPEVKGLLVTPLHSMLVEGYRNKIAMLTLAVGLILFIAVANVAGMFLARAPARRTELSVRAALGASRGRLISQLLSEGLWISGVAGLIGAALALTLEGVIRGLLVLDLPGLGQPSLSLPALGTALTLAVLTGLAAGVYPALAASSQTLESRLRGSRGNDRGGTRFRSLLVSGQVALSVMLLIGSGLLLGSLRQAASVDAGFEADGLLTAEIELPSTRYGGLPEVVDVLSTLEADLLSLPSVEGIAMANNLPLRDPGNWYRVWARSNDQPESSFAYRTVSPGYFETLGIEVLAGRGFGPADVRGAPEVALLSEGAARRLFPEGNAIGQTVVQGAFGEERLKEVVGIVRDVRQSDLESDPAFALYVPIAQRGSRLVRLAIRYEGDRAAVAAALREAVRRLDPNVPVAGVKTMEDVARDLVAGRRSVVTALTLYALLPLLMAAVGLYALLAYHVRMQRREIGIRLALGARPGELGAGVLYQGVRLGAVGVGLGLLGAFALSRLLTRFLFGVGHHDPVVFGTVALGVLGLTLVSTMLPARRALRTDLLVSLRTET